MTISGIPSASLYGQSAALSRNPQPVQKTEELAESKKQQATEVESTEALGSQSLFAPRKTQTEEATKSQFEMQKAVASGKMSSLLANNVQPAQSAGTDVKLSPSDQLSKQGSIANLASAAYASTPKASSSLTGGSMFDAKL